jgi:hypothetical protein
MSLDNAPSGKINEFPHVLNGTNRRKDNGRIFVKQKKRVNLKRPLACCWEADSDEETLLAEKIESELIASDIRGEDNRCVNASEIVCDSLASIVGFDGDLGSQFGRKSQPIITDINRDDAITECGSELDGVVAKPAGGTDNRNRGPGNYAVLCELLNRSVGSQTTAGQRSFEITHGVGEYDQRRRPHCEIFGEGSDDSYGIGAMSWFAGNAVAASTTPVLATGSAETEYDAISNRDTLFGAATECFDNPDSFVAERSVPRSERPIAACEMKVGVADTAR